MRQLTRTQSCERSSRNTCSGHRRPLCVHRGKDGLRQSRRLLDACTASKRVPVASPDPAGPAYVLPATKGPFPWLARLSSLPRLRPQLLVAPQADIPSALLFVRCKVLLIWAETGHSLSFLLDTYVLLHYVSALSSVLSLSRPLSRSSVSCHACHSGSLHVAVRASHALLPAAPSIPRVQCCSRHFIKTHNYFFSAFIKS